MARFAFAKMPSGGSAYCSSRPAKHGDGQFWPIKGLKPHEVAQREAWEEAGAKGRAKREAFGRFTYLKWLADDEAVPVSVAVHVLEVKYMKKNFPERGERKLDWVSPAEAARMVAEPDLQGLFRKFEFRYRGEHTHLTG